MARTSSLAAGMNPAQLCAAVKESMRRRRLQPAGTVLAAVSGGADSLTLMHVLHRLGYDVAVAHFDHRMRKGSEKDLSVVRREALKLGLEVHAGSREHQERRGESPEAWLRTQRLEFLEATARSIGASAIATGHTKSDQAETVAMRFISGSGRRGLAGIPPSRGLYIRPLIDVGREDTQAFCRSLKIKFVNDPTNADLDLRRNAVRHDFLPFVRARYNASIDSVLARTADIVRDEDELLDELASEAVEPEGGGGSVRIRAERLAKLHPALQRRAIRLVAPLDALHTEQCRMLALEGESGDQISLPLGLSARMEYGWLVLGPAPSSPAARRRAVSLEVPGITELPDWGASVRATVATESPAVFPDASVSCALDARKAGGGLVVRPPRSGDAFRPIGMRTTKKLSDFLSDRKVPRLLRADVPLIAGADGIVWIVGHRIDDRCKVTDSTKEVLVMEWIT